MANLVVAQLIYLESEDPDKDISVYINSPGGVIYSGLAIYDAMQYVKPEVSTICVGFAASMAALLLSAGAKGKRYALPNSRVMIHQPLGGAEGQAADIEIQAREILRLREVTNGIIARHTGKAIEQVAQDVDRNYWMSAEEAKAYGIVDEIIDKRKLK